MVEWHRQSSLFLRMLDVAPGTEVIVRRRRRLRTLRFRILGRSAAGRMYMIGSDHNDLCHRVWLNRVIRIEG
jgi:hypothetical protein